MSSKNRDQFILRRIKRRTIIDPETNCWRYYGSRSYGYGVIRFRGKPHEGVHRISAMIHHGYDLGDTINQINHKTICPYRDCWNPDHIYVGNQSQNTQDQKELRTLGNKSIRITSSICKMGHELTGDNLIIDPRSGKRRCRTCKNKIWRNFYRRSKNA